AEVFRVIRKGGCFLISLEASDPELGKAWTERIKGMTVYGAEELKQLLSQAGFSDIRVIQKKEELHIVAHK
ncbi:class I SAM-dependent methyltransferase, partial [Phocaeicola vulgatus]|nr:class I SAM-dependent methyltransferase [Phocaeicola vulgatus]